jgi:hypothetical protein
MRTANETGLLGRWERKMKARGSVKSTCGTSQGSSIPAGCMGGEVIFMAMTYPSERIYLSIYLAIYLDICLSIYLST